MKKTAPLENSRSLGSIVSLIDNARHRKAMAAWNIGKQINQDVLKNSRIDYGKTGVAEPSKQLTNLYRTGFSKTNLHNFIKFNELFPDEQIIHTLCGQLTWSHIRELIYINDDSTFNFALMNVGQYARYKTASIACFLKGQVPVNNPRKLYK